MVTDAARVNALLDLLDLKVPVATARAALSGFAWDEEELVTLTTGHIASVLDRFTEGTLGADEVVAWAESVHLRDDIGRQAGAEDVINEVLVEMSSPELFGELSETAPALRRLLQGPR